MRSFGSTDLVVIDLGVQWLHNEAMQMQDNSGRWRVSGTGKAYGLAHASQVCLGQQAPLFAVKAILIGRQVSCRRLWLAGPKFPHQYLWRVPKIDEGSE